MPFTQYIDRSVFKILTGKPTGKIPLGRTRCKWENNIRVDNNEIGIQTRNWIDLAQDRDCWRALVSAALNFQCHRPWSYVDKKFSICGP